MKVALRRWLELLGSMRLAITLLVAIALASVIGTLIPQSEPYANYQLQFGLFWFKQFEFLGIFDIYHTTWFIGLLGILLTSTSICVYRYTPSMLRSIRHWRPASASRVLASMPHTANWHVDESIASAAIGALVQHHGRFSQKKILSEGMTVLRWGSGYRLGYILTHCGIIFICLGGMLDSNLPFKWQQWRGEIVPEQRDLPANAIPEKSRLNIHNPSFRAQVSIPEGGEAVYAFQNLGDGYLLQPLDFRLKLDRFRIEYHTTGQPKAFVSDITVTTSQGQTFHQAVEVNKPFQLGNTSIYQSSFGDGGTGLAIRPVPLFGANLPVFPPIIRVFGKYPLSSGHTIEVNDFKPINVEGNPSATKEKEEANWKRFFSAVPKERSSRMLNMGSAWVYRDRDAQGQAREYHNYLEPILLDGHWYMVSGVREAMDQPFRYLRFPLTPEGYIEPYFLWRLYFLDASQWPKWAERFAHRQGSQKNLASDAVNKMAHSVLQLFAKGGYEYVASYLEKQVPQKEQQHIAELYLKILDQLSLDGYKDFYEGHVEWQSKMPKPDEASAALFVRESLLSISDSFLYGSPFYLQVTHIDPVQSSGFQITRSPGKPVVYGGCLLLVIGTFLLFYWRETRLWCWYENGKLHLALNSNRLDSLTGQRFESFKVWVDRYLQGKAS